MSEKTGLIRAILAALVFSVAISAKADIVTEFGMGYKLPSTSFVMRSECTQVISTQPQLRDTASCGGDNPAFIGWPIAWERTLRDEVFTIRAGWFHYSNWFDGGRDFETHMDLLAVTVKFNWSASRENRRNRRNRR